MPFTMSLIFGALGPACRLCQKRILSQLPSILKSSPTLLGQYPVTNTSIRQYASWLDENQKYQYRDKSKEEEKDKHFWMFPAGIVVIMFGASFAAVPLYKIFCQETGFGGSNVKVAELAKIEKLKKIDRRLIRVMFDGDVHQGLRWKFKPQQNDIWVHPGETALAFFTATNPTDKQIVGVSTYNIVPFDAALYFCKIQCFCFEEQLLNPGETVDMPVFFYIDPDFVDDVRLEYVDEIMLSYTFFESRDGLKLPDAFGGSREIRRKSA